MRNLLLVLGVIFFLGNVLPEWIIKGLLGHWLKRFDHHKRLSEVLDSWLGYDINLLVRRWGSPTDSFQARTNVVHFLDEQTREMGPESV